jgi:co-chaperonin GroES (HSP10)
MEKGFKVLRGKKVMLDRPEKKESTIELTPESEAAQDRELMKSWTKLNVFAVGTEVDDVKEGDKVYVFVSALSHAEVIVVNDKKKMIVNQADILMIW